MAIPSTVIDTRRPTMRYALNQGLFVVHFAYDGVDKANLVYRQPLLHDDVMPSRVNLKLLTVREHHKVRSEWDEPSVEPAYDGYLLTDEQGAAYSNQYPTASLGQTTDTGNRRFRLRLEDGAGLAEYIEQHPDAVFRYHLLSDLLEDIQRGIRELGSPEKEAWAKEKAARLEQLYTQIISAFSEAYPTYKIDLAWQPPYEGSSTLWPSFTFSDASGSGITARA